MSWMRKAFPIRKAFMHKTYYQVFKGYAYTSQLPTACKSKSITCDVRMIANKETKRALCFVQDQTRTVTARSTPHSNVQKYKLQRSRPYRLYWLLFCSIFTLSSFLTPSPLVLCFFYSSLSSSLVSLLFSALWLCNLLWGANPVLPAALGEKLVDRTSLNPCWIGIRERSKR